MLLLKKRKKTESPPKNTSRMSNMSRFVQRRKRFVLKVSRKRLCGSELCSEQMKLSEKLCDAPNWPSQAGHDLATTVSKNAAARFYHWTNLFLHTVFEVVHRMCLQLFINYWKPFYIFINLLFLIRNTIKQSEASVKA